MLTTVGLMLVGFALMLYGDLSGQRTVRLAGTILVVAIAMAFFLVSTPRD